LHLALGAIYGPELDKRCRAHLKCTNRSYRVDETYIRIKGQERYLYRAVDSSGQTIDFLLTAKRDAAAAKRFFRKMSLDPANPQPRVINVDKHRAYPAAVQELKVEGTLRRRCRLRQCKYLNNVVEQDHRVSKKRVWLARGYQSFSTAWRTLQGIEAVHMIRKGRARWWAKMTHSRNFSLSTSCLGWRSDAGHFGPWADCRAFSNFRNDTHPDTTGSGSAALDVGRRGLLQDPGLPARIRERPVPA
jgi:transposase-like protein